MRLLVQPIGETAVILRTMNPSFRASATQRKNMARINQRAERMNKDFGYALMLELDLMEFDPPEKSLDKHFKQLKLKEAELKNAFPCK